jgi:hypothetical protein
MFSSEARATRRARELAKDLAYRHSPRSTGLYFLEPFQNVLEHGFDGIENCNQGISNLSGRLFRQNEPALTVIGRANKFCRIPIFWLKTHRYEMQLGNNTLSAASRSSHSTFHFDLFHPRLVLHSTVATNSLFDDQTDISGRVAPRFLCVVSSLRTLCEKPFEARNCSRQNATAAVKSSAIGGCFFLLKSAPNDRSKAFNSRIQVKTKMVAGDGFRNSSLSTVSPTFRDSAIRFQLLLAVLK